MFFACMYMHEWPICTYVQAYAICRDEGCSCLERIQCNKGWKGCKPVLSVPEARWLETLQSLFLVFFVPLRLRWALYSRLLCKCLRCALIQLGRRALSAQRATAVCTWPATTCRCIGWCGFSFSSKLNLKLVNWFDLVMLDGCRGGGRGQSS